MKSKYPIWSVAAVTTFLCCVLLFIRADADHEETRKPNVILIMADDMGYECLSTYGSASYQTPHLDRLAGNGVRFENCFSQPLCTPSRVKIMTGKYNFRNYEAFGYLDPAERTFGNLFKDAGYATAIGGKWQLNGISDGQSFLPQILGKPGKPKDHIYMFYEPKWGRFETGVFVRDHRYKLYDDGRFYDLNNDVLEEHPIDLGSAESEKITRAKSFQKIMDEMRVLHR